MFDMLDNSGESFEMDVIALCCEYTEYPNALECAQEYPRFTDDETLDHEERVDNALKFLEENTQVIIFDGGIIIENF